MCQFNRTVRGFLVAASMLLAGSTAAHPISLSATLINVHEDRIEADIEIMLEDLVLYHDLRAGDDYRFPANDLQRAADEHAKFISEYFVLRDAEGVRLPETLKAVDKSKIEAEGVPQSELMSRYVTYKLEYAPREPPRFITVTQTFGGTEAVLPAVMDLMLLQNGVLLERPVQLTLGKPYTFALDWEHPPTQAPQSLRDFLRKRDEQLRERLGIASYGGLYSFLYINRQEVRHEVLIPMLTLERWVEIPRKDAEFLEVDEQAAARAAIARFFQERNPVSINGRPVRPKLTRLSFFGLDINDFALNAEPRRVGVYQARVGIILSYRGLETPREVSMRWETFNQFAPFLRSVVLIDDEDPCQHIFREEQTEFTWSGNLLGRSEQPRPVVSRERPLALEQASAAIKALLTNVYLAFEQDDDSAVYDALAASVAGDLLRDLYLRVKRSLVMAEQGGSLSRVQDIQLVSMELQGKPTKDGLQARCTWNVTGTVEHWGHIHTRANEYQALLTLRVADGMWKIAALEVIGEKRLRSETSLRGYR